MNHPPVIGIDIGGTKIAVAIVDEQGLITERSVQSTPAHSGDAVVAACIEAAIPLLAQQPRAVGVGTAGQVDTKEGRISFGNGNIQGWTDMPLGPRIAEALGLPVCVENDVNAMAFAEMRLGAGRGFSHALCITVGTGIGGCFILHGRPWPGAHTSGGEVGHLIADLDAPAAEGMMSGALERFCAGPALERIYAAASSRPDETPTLRKIAERASAGEALAQRVIKQGAARLGRCLGGLLVVLDPELLVVGGGVPHIGPLWWDEMEAALRSTPVPGVRQMELRQAELGVDAVLVGAAELARDRLLTQSRE